MSNAVQLENEQYKSYDEDGFVLATRSVRVSRIVAASESGPGICAVLRTGFEQGLEDGIGVQLTITDDQLKELGYVRQDPLLDFLRALGTLDPVLPEPFEVDDIIEAAAEPEPEPVRFMFCGLKERMVAEDECFLPEEHRFVYCSNFDKWVTAEDVNEFCIDKSGNAVPTAEQIDEMVAKARARR